MEADSWAGERSGACRLISCRRLPDPYSPSPKHTLNPPPPPTHQVYAFSRETKGRFSDGDFNLTVLYNTSTLYDDLAWAAGWLYKATKQVGWGGWGLGLGVAVQEEKGGEGYRVEWGELALPSSSSPPPNALASFLPVQDSYLEDVYEFYMKHLEDEGPTSEFK